MFKAECIDKAYGTAHEILVSIASVSSEGSDEPPHMHGLARAVLLIIYKVWK